MSDPMLIIDPNNWIVELSTEKESFDLGKCFSLPEAVKKADQFCNSRNLDLKPVRWMFFGDKVSLKIQGPQRY